MTAITLREAHTTPLERLLERLGLALVRYARTRSTRRERAVRREHALLAGERRREQQLRLARSEGRLGLR